MITFVVYIPADPMEEWNPVCVEAMIYRKRKPCGLGGCFTNPPNVAGANWPLAASGRLMIHLNPDFAA
jgi:hypothetical protein